MRPLFVITALFLSVLTGCTTLQKHFLTPIQNTRTNIATSKQVSHHALSWILTSGHASQFACMKAFETCLNDITNGFFDTPPDKARLALLAELHYAHARHLATQTDCKIPNRPPIDPHYVNAPKSQNQLTQEAHAKQQCQTAYRNALYQTLNHSYAYLFFDELTGQLSDRRLTQENDIKAQDLYHLATSELIDEIYKQTYGAFDGAHQDTNHHLNKNYQQYHISSHHRGGHRLSFFVDKEVHALNDFNEGQTLADLISVYDSRLRHLDATHTRSGLGVNYVGVLANRHTLNIKNTLTNKNDLANRIYPLGHVLLTAIAKPQGQSLEEILHSKSIDIHLFSPHRHKTVNILNEDYPLSANFSASYAMWLSENQLRPVGILNTLQKQKTPLPELFMLEPYNPNKKVVILLHGLGSSPATWVNFTNTLLSDPILQDNYQVWQVFYSTNLPILENRHQIHKLIAKNYELTDPTAKNPASRHSILIGHSMGGVIARMLVSDDNLLDKLDTNKKVAHQSKLHTHLRLSALPQIDTAVFVSAPFRGTDYAERWFARFARKVVPLPIEIKDKFGAQFTTESTDNLQSLYLQNGPSQLSDRSSFMSLTADIHIKKGVRYYSIMGDKTGQYTKGADTTLLSDGVVPYHSSHLAGATRETILTGGHNLHRNPRTIQELRKILYEHLATASQDK